MCLSLRRTIKNFLMQASVKERITKQAQLTLEKTIVAFA
jgi:hypothetical protein